VETPVKTERVTFLTAPDFKGDLQRRADSAGISVGELIRRQFQAQPSAEQQALEVAAAELRYAVKQAKAALVEANREVAETLAQLHARRRAPSRKVA
jgi:hypothetical protein